ncbi:MAG: DUF3108 domain-containing protein [Deltaproteobacteria bacterium]|nr:DUF3108 domain-containing protein [Deltaproteobacteria bacterium]
MPVRVLLLVILLLQLAPGPLQVAAAAAPVIREDLEYQISLGPWSDVARGHLVLKELEPGHYLAEFSGAAQGLWQLMSRWLPERYQTEMVLREGRLLPLVYREEFISKGRRILKEYRFDHERGRVSLWRRAEGGDKVKKWEAPLQGPVYDLLTLFYNLRLGAFGPLPGGSTLRVNVLPTPAPQEMVFVIGSVTEMGRKVMLDHHRPDSKTVNQYFFFLSPEQVPTQAWTRVTCFGKLAGRLLNPGEIRKEGLLTPPSSASPVPEAQP